MAMPGQLSRVALTACFCGLGINLQGCIDIYRDTCVWHSDLNIKGCSYYGYRGCVQHCHYCITQNGPDECAQLKCASYCAKRESDSDCLANFKVLCDIALDENLKDEDGSSTCNANCNAAARHGPRLPALLLLLGCLHGGRSWALLLCLAFLAFSLNGCGCSEWPAKQINWEPDGAKFDELTGRVVDGIWQGNPTWQWVPELENEDYRCVQMHPTKNFCAVWTSHEWNCGEHDFGICKCGEVAADGDYCAKWGCHSLEADQEICHHKEDSDGESGESCFYDRFPMDYNVYDQLMTQQATGDLTTGETITLTQRLRWWSYDSIWSNPRLLEESDNIPMENLSAEARLLAGGAVSWPPYGAYNPVARHMFFSWRDVCIVNGDNVQMAKLRCHQWREIETEISQCKCTAAEPSKKRACAYWTCEERDVGLFSILFRTPQDIEPYTTGVETEEYHCTSYNIDGFCTAWEGDIESLEEVEWTSCRCDGNCQELDATWVCDEYELPKTRDLFFETNHQRMWQFLLLELCWPCFLAKTADDDDGDGKFTLVVCSFCLGIIVLPFLVVTFGLKGFLILSLPFWACRCCLCFCACAQEFNSNREYTPHAPKPARPPVRARLARGGTKLMGRSTSSIVAPEESNETNETNELQ